MIVALVIHMTAVRITQPTNTNRATPRYFSAGLGATAVPSLSSPPAPRENATRPNAKTAGRPAPRAKPIASTFRMLSKYVIGFLYCLEVTGSDRGRGLAVFGGLARFGRNHGVRRGVPVG